MTNITLQDDYRRLTTTHQLYLRWRDRWEFLMNSYIGGWEYRNSGYLTRYALETDGEYNQRLKITPLSNYCAAIIQTYMSFLFREEPDREWGSWESAMATGAMPDVEEFLKDCDMDGRSFDDFMKQVAIWSSVFGHTWLILTKPQTGAETAAQEMAEGVRPYINLMTPLVVSDWRWRRTATGKYELVYFKYVEEVVDKLTTVREWTPESIKTWVLNDYEKTASLTIEEPNELGVIPAVLVYNQRGIERGIGVSDINDISDVQKMIFNMLSENEQAIRLGTHPTLVVPPTAQIGAGAGAMILLQDGSDPGLNPYMLEVAGGAVDSIHATIERLVASIDNMANTGGVRATASRSMSGIALETEFQLLNARLSEKADNLELAEEQIWRMYALYMGRTWDGKIEYPNSFNIRDTANEITQLKDAKTAATDPAVLKVIDEKILEALGEEEELLPYVDPNPIEGRTYSDGEAIPASLPPTYAMAAGRENCANCEYFKKADSYCIKFDAVVRGDHWCASWDGEIED
jgi:hypothetical protein